MSGGRSGVTYPMARQDPFHPPPQYAQLRAESSVVQADLADQPGGKVWLITRYEEAKQVLADTRFSSDSRRSGFPVKRTHSALIRMDPPEHTIYRRMLTAEFTERRMAELRPIVRGLTNDLLDKIAAAGTPVDLVPTLAMPLPSLVICRLLGVPYDDHEFLQERTATALRADSNQAEIDRAVDDLGEYMDQTVERKASHLADDLLSRLIVNHVKTSACSLATAADLARLLLVAGHVTTVNMIGLGILTLLLHPEQLAQLRADPALMEPTVNELLRHLSVAATLSRVATVDIEIGGTLIRAGDGVMVLISSANRDARVYDLADAFDIHRPEQGHLAFGWGPHLCLGASLARLELAIVLDAVIQRFPSLRLAVELSEIPFRHKVLIYGVHKLPVAW